MVWLIWLAWPAGAGLQANTNSCTRLRPLEDSSVGATVVLQDSKFVPRAFRLCRCLEETGAVSLRASSMLRRHPSRLGLYPSLSTVGCVGALSPVAGATVSGCTRCRIPPDSAHPPRPPLEKMKKKKTTPVAHTLESLEGKRKSGHWRLHEFGDLFLSFEKKQSGMAQIKPSARVSSSAADRRPPLVFMQKGHPGVSAGKGTVGDVPRYATPKVTPLKHVSTQASEAKHPVRIL